VISFFPYINSKSLTLSTQTFIGNTDKRFIKYKNSTNKGGYSSLPKKSVIDSGGYYLEVLPEFEKYFKILISFTDYPKTSNYSNKNVGDPS